LYNPDGQENVLFTAWKRIVSGRAKNAPFLPLNYRDARTVMIQNVNGIKSNDSDGHAGCGESCVGDSVLHTSLQALVGESATALLAANLQTLPVNPAAEGTENIAVEDNQRTRL
jgi:hypothetical protein